MENKNTIWTIGHSTRNLEDFIVILHSFRIEVLADVRSYPGSRSFPHFNSENLAEVLPLHQIEYLLIPDLGGRRKVNTGSLNVQWKIEL